MLKRYLEGLICSQFCGGSAVYVHHADRVEVDCRTEPRFHTCMHMCRGRCSLPPQCGLERREGGGDHECLGSCIATGTEKSVYCVQSSELCWVLGQILERPGRGRLRQRGRVHATYRKYRGLVVSSLYAKHGKFAYILEEFTKVSKSVYCPHPYFALISIKQREKCRARLALPSV